MYANKNFAYGAFASQLTAGATSMTLESGQGSRFPATGLSIGNIAAGEVRMVWMKRMVPAACASYSNNSYTLSMEGDAA